MTDREQEPTVPADDQRSSVDPEYFRSMYADSDDPWGFAERWYETRKYDITMSLLPAPRYERALELGSSIGVLSALLAQRCGSLVCLELDPRAAELARTRLGAVADRVAVHVSDIADGIEPDGDRFDLVVASEVLYYLDDPQLTAITEALDRHRHAGATVIAAHWRHHVSAYPWTGDEVHQRLRTVLGPTQATYTDDDVVIDVFTPPGTDWVGKAGGLA
ncbi:class I SAM-dependent DNA methyltransferase [Williamsia maris]|uniref:class I SAM-dependent DNA methyltransferase n=1 Tax=Williamsia maris TaxID=72806 RepID=UPI0020A4DEC2|nr:class I SAM-dependent methyltransferase [Williamsia maris]